MKNIIDPVETEDGLFHDGDQSTGAEGTIVYAKIMNALQGATISTQKELVSVLSKAGITPDETKSDQLLTALSSLFSGLIDIRVFTLSGTYTPGVNTRKIIVEAVGGGGSGGNLSVELNNIIAVSSGGSAGGYIKAMLTNIDGDYQVIVGAESGASFFGDQLLVAGGGHDGSSFSGGSPAAGMFSASTRGGTVSSKQDVLVLASITGQDGGYAFAVTDDCLIPGNGGHSPLGCGGTFHGTLNEQGRDGKGYGSGGSGVGVRSGFTGVLKGGKGTPGVVIIYEYS